MVGRIDRTTTSIPEFIKRYYFHGDGTPLFLHVYPSRLGVMEGILTKDHLGEAKRCVNFILTNLYSFMNYHSHIRVFADLEFVKENASSTIRERWEPLAFQESSISEYDQELIDQDEERRAKRLGNGIGKKINQGDIHFHGNQNSVNSKNSYNNSSTISTAQSSSISSYENNHFNFPPFAMNTQNLKSVTVPKKEENEKIDQISITMMKEMNKLSENLSKQVEELKTQQKKDQETRDKEIRDMNSKLDANIIGLTNAFSEKFKCTEEKWGKGIEHLNETMINLMKLNLKQNEQKHPHPQFPKSPLLDNKAALLESKMSLLNEYKERDKEMSIEFSKDETDETIEDEQAGSLFSEYKDDKHTSYEDDY